MRPPAIAGWPCACVTSGNPNAHLSFSLGAFAADNRAISAGWNRCCDTLTPHPVQCGPTKGFSNFAVAAPGQRFSWAKAVEVNAPMKMPRNAIIVNLLSINTSLARMNRARCRTTGKGDFDQAVRRWGERVGDDSKLDESCTDDPGPIRNFGFRI